MYFGREEKGKEASSAESEEGSRGWIPTVLEIVGGERGVRARERPWKLRVDERELKCLPNVLLLR